MSENLKERLQKVVSAPPENQMYSSRIPEHHHSPPPITHAAYGSISEAPVRQSPTGQRKEGMMTTIFLGILAAAVFGRVVYEFTKHHLESNQTPEKKEVVEEDDEEESIVVTDPFFQAF